MSWEFIEVIVKVWLYVDWEIGRLVYIYLSY